MKVDISSGLIEPARQNPSPNHDNRPESVLPSLIVIHNISLPPDEFGGSGIDELFTNNLNPDDHAFYAEICHLKVASHLLIRRDGEVVQYVPFHKRAFHAGISCYQEKDNCNDFSIGIELEGSDFVRFTAVQYRQLIAVITSLCETYPTLKRENITGHQHIAPGRKTDPGPFFDWKILSDSLCAPLPAKA
ncbi:MAG: N-acetylmuramoyl-L-alanine amidase (EC AmpD [uncultured Thiotrichaceae bacterium]|uniref:1,6-anhydro-N-acetylmuramyl-L-alanine amidase AmpD n=1 Tax=uncultured Thiotrichaceae bacterium TaxID=298394 RepID=A0A6S6SWF8_9GAMM|nr:MAG: N-acetylmuramoyl-L-alanine amidase (EC AmpD [uncultured Thiotrichaceae bacterium]